MATDIALTAQERKSLLKICRNARPRYARRAHVLVLLGDGQSHRQIRRAAFVSYSLIAECARTFRKCGIGAFWEPEKQPWSPKRLKKEQLGKLEELLREGASHYGWPNDWWTARRVAELIRRHFHQTYSAETARRILKRVLRWSPQRPVRQVNTGNDGEVEKWLANDFPRIVENAVHRNASLVFIDETGFMLAPLVRRTFAPQGHSPICKIADPHARISVIGAMIVAAASKQFSFLYRALGDNENFHGNSVARFLGDVRTNLRGAITIVWDRYCIHRARSVLQFFLNRHRSVVAEFFPPYSSNLNPVDEIWCHVKSELLPGQPRGTP
jgi:transposase